VETDLLTWAAGRHLPLLLAAEAPAGDDHTAQIIVALIGGLALVLVALVPALVNRQKKDAVTTPSPPAAAGATAEEVARIWTAIEGLRDGQQREQREHAGYEALLDECRRDNQATDAEVARLRDTVTRHVARPEHDGDR
jgi:hypothetical protein